MWLFLSVVSLNKNRRGTVVLLWT